MTDPSVSTHTAPGKQPLSRLGRAALHYASTYDWLVFPLAPRSKVPLKYSHGVDDATVDPAQIEDRRLPVWMPCWSPHQLCQRQPMVSGPRTELAFAQKTQSLPIG